MWELPSDSHTVAIQWAHMVVDPLVTILSTLGKGVYSQLENMHWKVDEHLKYLINFPKRKYSLEI